VAQELDDIALAWPDVGGEGLDVTPRERAQPGPGSSESVGEARDCSFNGEVAAEQRDGERMKERWFERRIGQRSAPTSLTLRELNCAARAETLMRRDFSSTRFPGVTPERPERPEGSSSRLGAIRCQREDNKGGGSC
jgi:hypothetical protein